MKNIYKIIIMLTFLLILPSCSKNAKPRVLNLTLGYTSNGIQVAGGAILKLVNITTGEEIVMDLNTPPYVAIIPNGDWTMYLVGFGGPAQWQGTTYCGSTTKTLAGIDIDIIINALATTCSTQPYIQLISTKITKWDSSFWDAGQWGP